MKYNTIVIIIVSIMIVIIIIYFWHKYGEKCVGVKNNNLEQILDKFSCDFKKNFKHDIEEYIEKIQNICCDNFSQLKKITALNFQPVTKVTNHFTETIDSDKHSDIHYLSDAVVNNLHSKTQKRDYYMSDNTEKIMSDSDTTSADIIINNNVSKMQTNTLCNNVAYFIRNNVPIMEIDEDIKELEINMKNIINSTCNIDYNKKKIIEIDSNDEKITFSNNNQQLDNINENTLGERNVTNEIRNFEKLDGNLIVHNTESEKIQHVESESVSYTNTTTSTSTKKTHKIEQDVCNNNTHDNTNNNEENTINHDNEIVKTECNNALQNNDSHNNCINKLPKDVNDYSINELREIAKKFGIKISEFSKENGMKKSRLLKKEELYNIINEKYKATI